MCCNTAFKENRLQLRHELQRGIGKFSALPNFLKNHPIHKIRQFKRRFRNNGPSRPKIPVSG
jgi:hypothetical protein